MTWKNTGLALGCALAIIALPVSDASANFEPTAGYRDVQIEGFQVKVSGRLGQADPQRVQEVLALLGAQLLMVRRAVPSHVLAKLQEVKIWINEKDPHGRHPGLVHHWCPIWLADHGYNPDMAGGVEIANVENYLTWSKAQPWVVMHELAHAYQNHAMAAADREALDRAYEQARASGIYRSVLNIDGGMAPAYAMQNASEYFAELTEAYFGTNDFYPFVRSELERHDPVGYALVRRVWQTRVKKLAPPKEVAPEEVAPDLKSDAGM